MGKLPAHGTWWQAIVLWLFTNLIGTVGIYLSSAMIAAMEESSLWANSTGAIEAIIGLIAAAASLLAIPVAFAAFRRLLAITRYWPRLLATGSAITSFFFLTVIVMAYSIKGQWINLPSVLVLGGWAYLLAALVSAARVYRRELFRTDAPAELSTDKPEEPAA